MASSASPGDPKVDGPVTPWLIPLGFSMAPALSVILFWSDNETLVSRVAKGHAMPVLAFEIATIVFALRNRAPPFTFRLPTIPLLSLLGIMWFAALMAPSTGRSILWTSFWFIHLGFGYAVATLFERNVALRSMMIGFIIFVALLGARAITSPIGDWESNPPGLDHIRRYGYYSAAVVAMAAGYFALHRPKILPLAAAVLGFSVIFWSGARGAIFGLIVGSLVSGIAFSPIRWRQFVLFGSGCGVIGLTIAYFIPAPVASMGLERMGSAIASQDFSTGRIDVWLKTWDAFLLRPVFGWGEAQAHLFAPPAQPHNIILQILLAWGVSGAVAVAVIARPIILQAYRNVVSSPSLFPAANATMVLLAYSVIDGTLFHVHSVSIFAMCAGLLVAPNHETRTG